jgi:methylmalonyl-CoA mutase N-terminal domain/subunit
MKIALRTQQIIAEETRVPSVIDPLGGSWYVESLTTAIEREVFEIIRQVDAMGGTVKAIEEGFFQKAIADSAYETARRRQTGEQPLIGVNRYAETNGHKEHVEIHKVDPDVERRQVARTRRVRASRDQAKVDALLDRLSREALDPKINLMPTTVELVKARATMGEIVSRLRTVFGTYTEVPVF